MPFLGSMCCICFGEIQEGNHFIDAAGGQWDVHRGDCAIQAGCLTPGQQSLLQWLNAIRYLHGPERVAYTIERMMDNHPISVE